jgi:hypothetical protein
LNPTNFHGLDPILDPQFWVPFGDLPELTGNPPNEEPRFTQQIRLAARLRPGVTKIQAMQELNVIAERLAQAHPETETPISGHKRVL